MAAIQYSETLLQNQDDDVPDYESSDEEDEYLHLQNPTKTPIISKDFLNSLTDIGACECQLFYELCSIVVFRQIFVRC